MQQRFHFLYHKHQIVKHAVHKLKKKIESNETQEINLKHNIELHRIDFNSSVKPSVPFFSLLSRHNSIQYGKQMSVINQNRYVVGGDNVSIWFLSEHVCRPTATISTCLAEGRFEQRKLQNTKRNLFVKQILPKQGESNGNWLTIFSHYNNKM